MKHLFLLIILVLIPQITIASLKDKDLYVVHKIEAYFNQINSLQADFIQTNHDGSTSEGKFYLQKPGKFRWQYDDPDPMLIIYNKKDLIYYDAKLDELSFTSPKESIIPLLTKEQISFTRDSIIKNVKQLSKTISLTLKGKESKDGATLKITFSKEPFELITIEYLDTNDQTITVNLDNVKKDIAMPPRVFSFHRPFDFFK